MRGNRLPRTFIALLAAVIAIGFGAAALAATSPVTVTVAVNGTPNPGSTVTAKATVTINDGSSLQGITWKQTGGVDVVLANTTTDTVSVTLPDRATFKAEIDKIIEEAPITDAQYPSYIPKPAKFESGIQNRFVVAGVSAHAVNDAAAIPLDVAVTTSSGTYHQAATVTAVLPYSTATGNRNVPVNIPVLLHGKTQASYNWSLTAPSGSKAALVGGTTQNPEFTPDVAGAYALSVTDLSTNKTVTINMTAGSWKGIIVGADANNRPVVDSACTSCHVKNTPNFDLFTPWAASGHAEIFTQNVNTANGHYGPSCLGCHTVGYNSTAVTNNGIDEQSDFQGFLASGLLTHGDPLNWGKILTQFPATARMANIQCENCHGPQDSAAHTKADGSRQTLSSDLCGTCHGEPPRHGRYQQWQLSGHGNYETAISEGTDPTCGKCHSAQGFLQWQDNNFSTANLNVTWTTEDVQPQSCQTCHDPHAVGTTSSDANTNATVRVSGTTPALMSGFTAQNVGRGAICMTCHNGRRGVRNDTNFSVADAARAPHEGPQADIIMGQNLYLTATGTPSNHASIPDTCVTCHMEKTDPPAGISLPGVGTNHTFYAQASTMCAKCHSNITAASVQGPVQTKLDNLKSEIAKAIKNTLQAQIRAGNSIDLNGTAVKNASDIAAVDFVSSHGSQGIDVTLASGTKVAGVAMTAVKVVRPAGGSVAVYSLMDPTVPKAGWNYFMVTNDKSKGVHNPAFVNSALDISLFGVKQINAQASSSTPGNDSSIAGLGGGLGNGAGAVACTTSYVYWAEIAGHAPGAAGSFWRTDLVARNLATSNANLRFVFHQPGGNLESTATINGSAQKAFEDVVATLGGSNNMGSLEICSDQPLLVAGRIFNSASSGTFGQNLDGHVADLGYSTGQTVSLIGLRQRTDAYRSNIVVTNGGMTDATVTINLFDATGKSLTSYNLTVPAGQVIQDNEPFRVRANVPDVDWGFATVTVVKGTNIQTSASLIDNRTNDPSTIAPKQ